MNEQNEKELRELINQQRARLEKLENDFRSAGRDLDDRFRSAFDPVGEKIAGKLGWRYSDSTKVTLRVIAIISVIAAIGYLASLAF